MAEDPKGCRCENCKHFRSDMGHHHDGLGHCVARGPAWGEHLDFGGSGGHLYGYGPVRGSSATQARWPLVDVNFYCGQWVSDGAGGFENTARALALTVLTGETDAIWPLIDRLMETKTRSEVEDLPVAEEETNPPG